MLKPLQPLMTLAVVLALVACGNATAPRAGVSTGNGLRYGALVFKPCALSVARLDAVEAQCATVPVPENHDAPQGRRIDLAVAWIPAKGEAQPDPIYMIAGGPGQSALESYPMVHAAFADARRTRHVILVDARGTGGSHPLRCVDRAGNSAVMEEGDESPDAARAFADRHPNFRFMPCLSRELPAPGSAHAHADVRHGYVQQFLAEFAPKAETDIAYLCGNPNMVDACFEALKGFGLPVPQIRREKYVSSK